MANNIVKELNEIKDNYDTEIKDGKNMVEALDGIREAIEQDGEYTSSKNVANAVKDLGVALKEHDVELRNFTLTINIDEESPVEDLSSIPIVSVVDNGTTGKAIQVYTDPVLSIGSPLTPKLPVINGECVLVYRLSGVGFRLDETSSGCTLSETDDGYVLSIDEDNAIVNLTAFSQI